MKWKRMVSTVLVICCILTTAGCSNGKKEAAKVYVGEIYDELKAVYENVDVIAGDVYQAWAVAISQKKTMQSEPIDCLVKNTHLSAEDIEDGVGLALAAAISPDKKDEYFEDYMSKTAEEKRELREVWDKSTYTTIFNMVNPLTDFCVFVIQDSYYLNGSVAAVQEKMDTIKEKLKDLEEKYPDCEGLDELKNIYTQTNVYFEFCTNPSGTILTAMKQRSEYQDAVKKSIAELDYMF